MIVGFLGRLGRRLPLSPRMALRDAARNRGRTAPAVAAVMAAVAGSVAIATYMASDLAGAEADYTPILTKGTVVITSSDAKAVERLPLARAAVEQNMAVTGGHADYGRAWAGSDCIVYSSEENGCGTLEMIKPTGKGRSCPLKGKGAKELAARLSSDEHKKLRLSPACLDEYINFTSFGTDENKIIVADAAMLSTYVKLDDPAAAKALAAGTPVLLNPAYAKNGEVTLKAFHKYNDRDKKNRKLHPGKARTTTDRLKVYVAPTKYATTPGIRMILPQRTAERLGLHTEPSGSVYAVSHPPTEAEDQRVSGAIEQAGWRPLGQVRSRPRLARRHHPADPDPVRRSGDPGRGGDHDRSRQGRRGGRPQHAQRGGRAPRVRRSLSGFQCVVVALTGVVLGTLAGLVPAVALRLVDLRDALQLMRLEPMQSAYTPIVLPWATIGLLVVCIPLLAGVLAAAFTRSRLALARRAG